MRVIRSISRFVCVSAGIAHRAAPGGRAGSDAGGEGSVCVGGCTRMRCPSSAGSKWRARASRRSSIACSARGARTAGRSRSRGRGRPDGPSGIQAGLVPGLAAHPGALCAGARRVGPGLVKQMYQQARAAMERKDRDAAISQFEAMLRVADDADIRSDPTVAELKVLGSGFLELSRAMGVQPAPPAVPAAPRACRGDGDRPAGGHSTAVARVGAGSGEPAQ